MSIWPGATKRIGLEICAEEIRWLLLSSTRQGFRMEHYGILPWSAQGADFGQKKYWQQLSLALKEWVSVSGFIDPEVAVAMPAERIISKKITLTHPRTEEETMAAIMKHLQTDLPGMSEQVCVDYIPLSTSATTQEILYIATKKEALTQFITTMNEAGIKVLIVDVDYYALARVLSHALVERNVYAVLVMEGMCSRFIVFHAEEVLYVRQWQEKQDQQSERVKQILQHFITSNRHIVLEQIYVVGAHAHISKSVREFGLSILPIHFRNILECAAHLDVTQVDALMSRLLICCGLAMRDKPPW